MSFTFEEIKKELNDNWKEFQDLDEWEASDRLIEYADGYCPIYTNEVIKEWSEMPSEFDDSWKEHLGNELEDRGIVSLMSFDLFTYYSELTNQAWRELSEEKKQND